MRLIVTGILVVVSVPSAEADSFFFQKNFVRGYADFEVNPPGGERDLGRCRTDPAAPSDPASSCAAFTRYTLGGYVELQPLGRKVGSLPLNRLFLFLTPNTFYGRNPHGGPATLSMRAILFERSIGVGIILPANFEFRLWQHRNYWLGRYTGVAGPTDRRSDGPYGLYAAAALRWNYGWGRFPTPRQFLRGYAEFEIDPPHNERDLGRCASSAGTYGGANAPCTAFARYKLGGYAEFQPFQRKVRSLDLQRLMFITEPKFYSGRNVPQFRYSASMEPILLELRAGLAVEVTRGFEFRIVFHRSVWLGRHRGNLGPADSGSGGPYGSFASFGLRWYFGGWGRSPSQ